MWAGLIDFDWDTLDFKVGPDSLAREMPKISADGRTFTYTLRDDIKWSDNRPITSADFLFAWENASKEENNWVGLDDAERIETFRAPDARTVEVTLTEPFARYIAISASALIGPVPKHVWEGKSWLDPNANPEIVKPTVVSGPFMPKDLGVERHSYVRNPNYWGTQPNLDQIEFVAASPQTVLELLKTNQVEWAQNFPPAQYLEAKRLANANVIDWSGATGNYRLIEFNLRRSTISDKRFREALVRAVNRADLVQFEDDLGVPHFSLIADGNTKWANPGVEHYDFDLSRAKSLLEEAGYRQDGSTLRDRVGQPVRIEIVWPTTSQPRGKMAAYLQQQWKQLGIDATVTGLEFNAYVDKVQRQKDFDVGMGAFGAPIDPDDVKSQIKSDGTQNVTGYNNPRVDELIKLGAVERDDARRKAIYDEMQKIVVDDLPVYYMILTKSFTAFDKKVRGVTPGKGGDILTQNNMQVLHWYLQQ
jgi:peptide/nickel transport system substrate-binding protein